MEAHQLQLQQQQQLPLQGLAEQLLLQEPPGVLAQVVAGQQLQRPRSCLPRSKWHICCYNSSNKCS